jgi:polyisoprenoid-binding protein YceI
MKKLLMTAALLLAVPGSASAATYTLDPAHTAVEWRISHFGFSSPQGKFPMITGTIDLDEKAPQNAKLSVTVPVANVVTGVEKLDEHLKGKDFFDVETYPTASFVSHKVKLTGKHTAKVEGTLTLHGVSKTETLDVVLNKSGENMFKKQTVGFTATGAIKRSDYGMKTYLPGLGDEVKLHIESEANL